MKAPWFRLRRIHGIELRGLHGISSRELLQRVSQLTQLRVLILTEVPGVEENLGYLEGLDKLELLDLSYTDVGDVAACPILLA